MFHILPPVHIGSDQFRERPYDDNPGPSFDYVIECRAAAIPLRRIIQWICFVDRISIDGHRSVEYLSNTVVIFGGNSSGHQ